MLIACNFVPASHKYIINHLRCIHLESVYSMTRFLTIITSNWMLATTFAVYHSVSLYIRYIYRVHRACVIFIPRFMLHPFI